MNVIKALCISFSMYSQIPMPLFDWEEENMKYVLCFFPWVGAVIGASVYLWGWLSSACGVGKICYALIGAAVPIIITGGIHMDGYMDTMDAFRSFQEKEKKLEIMKDPHIGAFGVISAALYGLVYIGAFSEIEDAVLLRIFCAGFVLSRCLSAIGAVTFPAAKTEGMLYAFVSGADKKRVRNILYVQTILCIGFMIWQSVWEGFIAAGAAFLTFAYYRFRCQNELGGITGDTAGWFTVVCEGSVAVTAAMLGCV